MNRLLEPEPWDGYLKRNPNPGSQTRGRSLDREGSLGKELNLGICF